MKEYRLFNLNNDIKEAIEDLGVNVFEEEFSSKITHLIYSDDILDDVLDSLGIKFESKDQESTGWQEKWKEFIKEGYLTDDIYFVFEPKKFDDNRKTLYINPSLAFGTGNHATTKLSAQLMTEVVKGKTVLDIGTGSGILSIAASMKGADKIFAFDIDDMAINNLNENIANNGCKNIYPFIATTDAINKDKKYDIVIANIISGVLLNIVDDISKIAGEYIIYSGILEDEYNNIIRKLTPNKFKIDKKLTMENWIGVRLKKVR